MRVRSLLIKCKNFFYLIFLSTFFCNLAFAESEDELFKKVFGESTEQQESRESVLVPLILNQEYVGDFALFVDSENNVNTKIIFDPLAEKLKEVVLESVYEKLLNHVEKYKNKKVISVKKIAENGIEAEFFEDSLQLTIFVPLKSRKKRIFNLREYSNSPVSKNVLVPSNFSSFLNIRGKEDWNFDNEAFARRSPLQLDFDLGVNYKKYVLEAEGFYVEDDADAILQRGDIRFVKDFPDKMIRASVGDLNYAIDGFQNFVSMAGFSITREFDLQPFKLINPTSTQSMILKRRSQVKVYVNDQVVRTVTLPAGRHKLINVPVSSGTNNIRYEITDSFGNIEYIERPYAISFDLLKSGLHQYNYSVGFPSASNGASYAYDTSLLTYSAYHNYGLRRNLTINSSAQGNKKQNIFSAGLIFATDLGTFATDVGYSLIKNFESDYKYRLFYNYRDYYGEDHTQRDLQLLVEGQGYRYSSLGNLDPTNTIKQQITLSYAQQIFYEFSLGATLGYEIYRRFNSDGSENNNASRVTLSLTKRWFKALNSSINYSFSRSRTDERDHVIFMLFSLSRSRKNQFITYSTDSSRKSHRVDWRYNGTGKSNRYNVKMGADHSEGTKQYDAQFDFIGDRIDIAFNHVVSKPKSESQSQSTGLRFGTAIAFVNGAFALSRPISDSFVMVDRPDTWKDQSLNINYDGVGSYDSQVNNWGAAVVPDLTSYQHYNFHIDSSLVDEGYQVGEENHSVFPSYKSGSYLRVGTNATVLVQGTLTNQVNAPIALLAGQILDSEGNVLIDFFTDRKGRFEAEGISSGNYTIKLYDENFYPVNFTVEEGTVGRVQLGTLISKSKKIEEENE